MVIRCRVPGCNNASENAILHCLPSDPEVRKKWCDNLGRSDWENVCDKRRYLFRVCSAHFPADVYFANNRNRSTLKKNAIPILALPGTILHGIAANANAYATVPVDVDVPSTSHISEMTASTEEEALTSTSIMVDIASGSCAQEETAIGRDIGLTPSVGLLKSVGVARAAELTPKAKQLYKVAKDLKRVARRLKFYNVSSKDRLNEALQYSESSEFLKTKISGTLLKFIDCQLRMFKKNPRGRRFSFDEKIFALSLLKQSPKAYKALRMTFVLPSRRTLINILNQLHIKVGINARIMQVLNNSCNNLDLLDRHCCLMFDEIFISTGLTYDKKFDEIVGFEDVDGDKKLRFADHAVVFMIKGLRKKWKQPISFHFSQGPVNSTQLCNLIKNTILALQGAGFIIDCVVCDQFSANVNAIYKLKSTSPRHDDVMMDIFEVGGQEIVAIYDPPHLLKGIRNNLLIHNVKCTINDELTVARWDDVVSLYELDEGDYNTRMCYKLTDAHIYKEKLKKMKVKFAAQVFSHRVSTTMRWIAKRDRELPLSAVGTANFVSFMDQLFDSVNGAHVKPDHGKILRCAITQDSPHIQFWSNAIKTQESMHFVTQNGEERNPPSIKNWIKTIKGLIYLWRKLNNEGFRYLCLRNINQDPLENFFGCIRSHGVRNINPTAYSFTTSFKTLIINNFTSIHSPGANCEEDDNVVLDSLKSLLSNGDHLESAPLEEGDEYDVRVEDTTDYKIISTHAYIAGYISRSLKKKIGGCRTCMNQMNSTSSSEEHALIVEYEYRPHLLTKTKTQFRRMFSSMVKLFTSIIHKYILRNNLKRNLQNFFERNLYNPFLCSEHNLFKMYIDRFLTLFIFTYIKNVNGILKGVRKYSLKENDVLKKYAYQRYLSLKGKNKKIADTKKLQ